MTIIKFHGKTIWDPQYDCYIQISVITWYVKKGLYCSIIELQFRLVKIHQLTIFDKEYPSYVLLWGKKIPLEDQSLGLKVEFLYQTIQSD